MVGGMLCKSDKPSIIIIITRCKSDKPSIIIIITRFNPEFQCKYPPAPDVLAHGVVRRGDAWTGRAHQLIRGAVRSSGS